MYIFTIIKSSGFPVCYGGGTVRQNTTVLYPTYYAEDDMFRPLWAIFRSQKCLQMKTTQSMIIVWVHIVNFQREIIVGWIIHIELKVSILSKI